MVQSSDTSGSWSPKTPVSFLLPSEPNTMSETPSIRRRAMRVCRLFWCHQCLRTVRIIASPDFNVFCPRCYGSFLHELDFPRPRPLADSMGLALDHPYPLPHFLDSLSAALGLSDSWLLFRHHAPDQPDPPPLGTRQRAVPPTVHPGDYFTGAGLEELIEGLTQNDRPGPPPAPPSAIDAVPTVAIEEAHLSDGSQCPVCKEDFGVGEEAREMPCKHVYHSDCIVPWLRAHNSCPVCRFALPAPGESRAGVGTAARAVEEEEEEASGGRRSRGWWNPFSLLWPFGRPSPPSWGYDGRRREDDDSPGGNGGDAY